MKGRFADKKPGSSEVENVSTKDSDASEGRGKKIGEAIGAR